jgi:tetratricopeptide (TPR) repeat protein
MKRRFPFFCLGVFLFASISANQPARSAGAIPLVVNEVHYRCLTNEKEEAIKECTNALRQKPWGYLLSRILVQRAIAYSATGQNELALTDFKQATLFKPNGTDSYMTRGMAYSGLGEHASAIKDYDEAIKRDKDNSNAHANRGLAYFSLGEFERAIQDYDRAIKLSPSEPALFELRGAAYDKLDQASRALEDYEQAKKLTH